MFITSIHHIIMLRHYLQFCYVGTHISLLHSFAWYTGTGSKAECQNGRAHALKAKRHADFCCSVGEMARRRNGTTPSIYTIQTAVCWSRKTNTNNNANNSNDIHDNANNYNADSIIIIMTMLMDLGMLSTSTFLF